MASGQHSQRLVGHLEAKPWELTLEGLATTAVVEVSNKDLHVSEQMKFMILVLLLSRT